MGWNVEYAKSVSKADWIKQHAHHADEFDLAAEYDKITGKKDQIQKDLSAEEK